MKSWLLVALSFFFAGIFFLLPTQNTWSDAKIAKNPSYRRVVSLAPSFTETIIALNETYRLVGVTVHCTNPAVEQIPRIGSFAEPNFEAIMAQNPDLVVAVPHAMATGMLNQLAERGIEVFAHQPDTLKDIKYITEELALKFDVPWRGQSINGEIDQAIFSAQRLFFSDDQKKSVLIAISPFPLVVAGATYAAEIVEAMGFKNQALGKTAWPLWPAELLLAEPPDYFIVAGGNQDWPAFDHLFKSLKIDVKKHHPEVILPHRPIFNSPSPALIKDIDYLVTLLNNQI